MWEYLNRIGVFASALAGFTLLTGTFNAVQSYFLDRPKVGIILLVVDVVLFLIQKLGDRETDERERRLRERKGKIDAE